ncbi:hypothetical protein AVEN_5212-1 [Araneus ventricosus]|uniref:Uncharacterized protein n=1 Tax=Araneus ventricosus TaxID=182803 RepID=A0A4Y2G4V4_ARAVE|nr:hypothetical protein AVEN_5212-1 [Araneus ventricosus]
MNEVGILYEIEEFSLVILAPRFEATRSLFSDGPCSFKLWLDDEDDTRAGYTFPSFHATPLGRHLIGGFIFSVNQAHMHIRSSVKSGLNMEPSDPKPETLRLGYRSPNSYQEI